MYKCIKTEFGVDVSVSKSSFFHYNDKTHMVTDLGSNRVRITRKIDGLHEIYDTAVANFTDLTGTPFATTAAELSAYFATNEGSVKAGEGVSVNNNTVSVVAGGPATLGGFKVGTGLVVDGSGRLSASASSEVTKVISNEAEMLAQIAEPLRPYRVIRLDTKRLYYLNAGDSPAVLANWFEGPSIETTVLSFKGRTGAVEPALGDYTFEMIHLTDGTTAATHKFVIDNGALFIENVTTAVRKQIAYNDDFDLAAVESRLTSLEDLVSSPATGLIKKVSDLTTTTNQLNSTINNPSTGLVAKVASNEQLTLAVNDKVDSTAANTVVLDQRVSALESGGGSSGGVTTFNGRTGAVAPQSGDYITDWISETLTKQFVTPEQKAEWSAKETTNGAQAKATAAQANAKNYADMTFVPFAQKGALNGVAPLNSVGKLEARYIETGTASGVAPLGTASKVPMVHILSDVAGGLPVLDSSARLPVERLPSHLPIAPRSWYNVKGSRSVGSWYTNQRPGNNELTVYVRSASSASTSREIRASIRKAGTTTTFTFQSDAIESTGNRWLQLQLQVPQGWEYQITTSGGSTTANIETWYELY
ncbi:hypothetical protein Roomu2_00193 [Pseudomonas phage vB_PpuM-Roomu-2]|uniref:Tail fiber protein n=1 Tax=Pseudomonas phage vB_PpuM-Roomu-2 TaxID=3132621 RepID=A0AAX4MYJ3_9CAUD